MTRECKAIGCCTGSVFEFGVAGARHAVQTSRLRLFWCVLIGCASIQPALGQTAMPESLIPLQGTWIVSSAEQSGGPLEALQGAKLTIGEDSFELQAAASEFRGKIRIRTDGSPKQIDFLLTSGAVWRGIFVVTAKLLRINYVDARTTAQRPRLFATSPDEPGTLLVMSHK